MRTIIAGSRTIVRQDYVNAAMAVAGRHYGIVPTLVLSGRASGVDLLGEQWAREHGLPVELYPADWRRHPEKAGLLRNSQMAHACEALVAIWDGRSTGTLDMVNKAVALKRRVYLCQISA